MRPANRSSSTVAYQGIVCHARPSTPSVSSPGSCKNQGRGRPFKPIQQRKRGSIRQVILAQHQIKFPLRELPASLLKRCDKLTMTDPLSQPRSQRRRSQRGITGHKHRRRCAVHSIPPSCRIDAVASSAVRKVRVLWIAGPGATPPARCLHCRDRSQYGTVKTDRQPATRNW